MGTVEGRYQIVSGAVPDDAEQDQVVCGAEFGVAFMAKGPRTASIQKGLERERYFLLFY